MLDVAHERVCIAELARAFVRQQLLCGERGQRRPDTASLQRRMASTPDQLVHLSDEFDFTDAARAELDVIPERCATALRIDPALHFAERLDRTEIEIAPEHEWLQRSNQ